MPLTLDPKTPFGYLPVEATTDDQSNAHYRHTSRKVGKHPRVTMNPGRHRPPGVDNRGLRYPWPPNNSTRQLAPPTHAQTPRSVA